MVVKCSFVILVVVNRVGRHMRLSGTARRCPQQDALVGDGVEVDGIARSVCHVAVQRQHRVAVGEIDSARVIEKAVLAALNHAGPFVLDQAHLEHRRNHLDAPHLNGTQSVGIVGSQFLVGQHALVANLKQALAQLFALLLEQLWQAAVVVEPSQALVLDILGMDAHHTQVGRFDIGIALLAKGQGELQGTVAAVERVEVDGLDARVDTLACEQQREHTVGLGHKAGTALVGVIDIGLGRPPQCRALLEHREHDGQQHNHRRQPEHIQRAPLALACHPLPSKQIRNLRLLVHGSIS